MKKVFAILAVAFLATGVAFAAENIGKKKKKKCAKKECCKKDAAAKSSCCKNKTASM
jgi:uncharacterized protein YdeI (BOF family)